MPSSIDWKSRLQDTISLVTLDFSAEPATTLCPGMCLDALRHLTLVSAADVCTSPQVCNAVDTAEGTYVNPVAAGAKCNVAAPAANGNAATPAGKLLLQNIHSTIWLCSAAPEVLVVCN